MAKIGFSDNPSSSGMHFFQINLHGFTLKVTIQENDIIGIDQLGNKYRVITENDEIKELKLIFKLDDFALQMAAAFTEYENIQNKSGHYLAKHGKISDELASKCLLLQQQLQFYSRAIIFGKK